MAIQTFKMSDDLKDFDIFPKVFVTGKASEIHIRPLGQMWEIRPNTEYVIVISGLDGGLSDYYPESAYFREFTIITDEQGCFSFEYCFTSEQEYFIQVMSADKSKRLKQFEVYCVEQDLEGRYPFIIPSGQAFSYALKQIEKIHRDTFHASLGVGRFILALVWYKAITGNDIDKVSFHAFDEEVWEDNYY